MIYTVAEGGGGSLGKANTWDFKVGWFRWHTSLMTIWSWRCPLPKHRSKAKGDFWNDMRPPLALLEFSAPAGVWSPFTFPVTWSRWLLYSPRQVWISWTANGCGGKSSRFHIQSIPWCASGKAPLHYNQLYVRSRWAGLEWLWCCQPCL